MTLILDLPPDVEAQLAARATEQGVEPTTYALQLLRAHLPPMGNGSATAPAVEAPEDPTLALLRQWERERDAMTPEERTEAATEWETFRNNINATRAAAGARLLYPYP